MNELWHNGQNVQQLPGDYKMIDHKMEGEVRSVSGVN